MPPRPWIGRTTWAAMARLVAVLSRFPLFGGIVQRYTAHYDEANREPAAKFSERMRGFFERWSVKFTAEYYDGKERQDAAKGTPARSAASRVYFFDAIHQVAGRDDRAARAACHCGRSTSPCGPA